MFIFLINCCNKLWLVAIQLLGRRGGGAYNISKNNYHPMNIAKF